MGWLSAICQPHLAGLGLSRWGADELPANVGDLQAAAVWGQGIFQAEGESVKEPGERRRSAGAAPRAPPETQQVPKLIHLIYFVRALPAIRNVLVLSLL